MAALPLVLRRFDGSSSRRARASGLATTGTLLAGAWLCAAPAMAASAPTPAADDHAMHWPLGQCVEDKLVLGHLYDVQQDFDNENDSVGRCQPADPPDPENPPGPDDPPPPVRDLKCRHAGFDMHRSDDPAQTYDSLVFAMADGEVVDIIDWGDEGVGVLVRHDNGLIAHYVHLRKDDDAMVHVRRGQRVRTGQPLGRIMDYPYFTNNDHLHLEIRGDITVKSCPSGTCATVTATSCKGNGYALAPSTTDIASLSATQWGYQDPTSAYFENRPAFPATIAVERGPLDFVESAGGGEALGQLAANVLMSSPEEPRLIGEHGWYSVIVGEGDEATTRHARGFTDLGYGGDIAIGEVPQLGRDWIPPTATPLVDLRFGASARTTNWGTGTDASVDGGLRTAPPYPESQPQEFCDQVADLDGSIRLELAVPSDTSFVGGVAVDLSLRLDAFEEAGTIAMSGDPEAPTWRLAVRKDGDVRQLVFEVTLESEEVESITMDLPEPRCAVAGAVPPSACDTVWSIATADCPATACDPDQGMPAHCFEDFGYRQWRHVAARYDVGTNTFELLWDGLSVEQRSASESLLDAEDRTVKLADGLSAAIDDVRVWAIASEDEDKEDDIDGWGGGPRGTANEGCNCTAGSGSGSGGSALVLLGLWALRRRRSR